MGYEVLDGGGQRPRSAPTPSVAGAVDVVDLSDVPPAGGGEPGGTRRRVLDGQLRRLAGGGLFRSRPARYAAATAVAGLVVGLLLGGRWGAGPAVAGLGGSDASRISVMALTSLDDSQLARSGDEATVSLQVRLLNLGPAGVSVITSAAGARPGAGQTTVAGPDGETPVAPGSSQTVTATVGADCTGRSEVGPTLSVRTEDGSVHRVKVLDNQLADFQVTAQDACDSILDDADNLFAVTLTGSVGAPSLALANHSDHDIQVVMADESAVRPVLGARWWVSGAHAVVQYEDDNGSRAPRVRLSPALPVVVPAGQTQRVTVRLTVPRCLSLDAVTGQGGLSLAALATDGTQVPQSMQWVDLSAALGVAAEAACHAGPAGR